MRRRGALAIGAAATVGIGAGIAAAWHRGEPSPPGGAPVDFWSTAVLRPDGSPLSLEALRGRPLLVNFWATWCLPCVTELPLLDRFHGAANGWQVVALALDSAANVRRFLERMPLALPVGVIDAGGYDLPRRLGNPGGGLPFTIVCDAAGRIALRHLGAVDRDILDTWVSALN